MGVGGSSPSAPTNCILLFASCFWWSRTHSSTRADQRAPHWRVSGIDDGGSTSVLGVRRLCERPGCAAPADVSYGIDKIALTVWVDNRAIPEREHAGRLCRRHANALIVPRGWTLDDRREAIPRLFKALAEEVAAQGNDTKRKPRTKRAEPAPVAEAPTLFEPPVDADETQAIPWSPRLAPTAADDEKSDEAPVFGRLLGRAFGQKNARHEDDE